MAIGTFTNGAIETELESLNIEDAIATTIAGAVSTRGAALFDALDAAIVDMGAAPRTDGETTNVTFSTAGKALLTTLLLSTTPQDWSAEWAVIAQAQNLVAQAADSIPTITEDNEYTFDDTPAVTGVDVSAVADNIYDQAQTLFSNKVAVFRAAVARAFESFGSCCVPALTDATTFSDNVKTIAGVIVGSTPLEGWPNFVFDMLNDEYVGAFQGSVVVGPNGGDLYVP